MRPEIILVTAADDHLSSNTADLRLRGKMPKGKLSRPLFIFERLKEYHRFPILLLLKLGCKVELINFNLSLPLAIPKWALALQEHKNFRLLLGESYLAQGQAIDAAVEAMPQLEELPLFRLATDLLGDRESARLVVQKQLLNPFTLCLTACQLLQTKEPGFHFISENFFQTKGFLERCGAHEFPDIQFSRLTRVCAAYAWGVGRLRELIVGLFGILYFSKRDPEKDFVPSNDSSGRAVHEYGVLINSWNHLENTGHRGFDFLLDGKAFRRDNTVFLLTQGLIWNPAGIDTDKWVQDKRKEGYNVHQLRFLPLLRKLANGPHLPIGLQKPRLLKAWLERGCPSLPLRKNILELGSHLEDWKSLLETVQMKNFIYTSEDNWAQVAGNAVLRAQGATSIYYSYTFAVSYVFSHNEDLTTERQTLWAFQNPDIFFCFSEDFRQYYDLHKRICRKIEIIGCIHSQAISDSMAQMDRGKELQRLFPDCDTTGRLVVSYFDTNYWDYEESDQNCMVPIADGIQSYKDFLRLVVESEDILLVVKPKFSEDFFTTPSLWWSSRGPELVEVWKELKAHPRIHWASVHEDPARIIGLSELVITYCMSSPSAEALYAGKKAFWYCAGTRHKDVLLNQIPGMVMSGYDELKGRTEELLKLSDEDFEDWQETWIRPRFGALAENRALDKMRASISQIGEVGHRP